MKRSYFFVALLLGIHLFFLSNLRFTAWPEMLSYPYLRNNGFLLYKDMIHPYPPLLTMGLSYVYGIFGYGLWVLQSVAWVTILVSALLIFLIIREVTRNDKVALASLTVYVFLQPFLEGNMLWFDIGIIPPILLGTLFALRRKIFLAGLSLSVALLIKQTAGIFLILFFLFILLKRIKVRELAQFVAAPLILLLPLLVRLVQEGALQDFVRWTLVYPLTEWGRYPGYVQMSLTSREWAILLILFLPIIAAIAKNIVRRKDLLDNRLQLLGLFLLGALFTVYPRFSFFHFQPALAFLAIWYAVFLGNTKKLAIKFYAFCFVLFVLALRLIHLPTIEREWNKEARFYGSPDLDVAQTINATVAPGEQVFLVGLHSGLYAMASRLPPKRWTDNFGWYLEIPSVQEEIVHRWDENPPKVIFWQEPEPGQWYELGTYQPQKIVEWIEKNYTKKEEVKPRIWLWLLKPDVSTYYTPGVK